MRFSDIAAGKKAVSAGILLVSPENEFFLVKPFGPHYNRWGISKGHLHTDEDAFQGAVREFYEETGIKVQGEKVDLGEVTTPGGLKVVKAFMMNGSGNEKFLPPKEFYMDYKGRMVPECVKGQYFSIQAAKDIIVPYQLPLLETAEKILKTNVKL